MKWLRAEHKTNSVSVGLSKDLQQLPVGDREGIVKVESADTRVPPTEVMVHLKVNAPPKPAEPKPIEVKTVPPTAKEELPKKADSSAKEETPLGPIPPPAPSVCDLNFYQ